ncbi:MAG TPA: hypothetical protein VEU33_48240, partial [Archangium sp.]|nr:hypothetical protein [Archangium sp.]
MRQIFPVLLVSILCGCASTKLTARPTSAAPDNKQVVEGLRYYLPMPYIHVSKPILLASNSTGDSRTTEVTVELAPAAAAAKKKAAPGAGGTRPQSEGGEGGLGAGVNDEKPEEGVKEEEEQEETTSAAAKPAEDGVSIVMLPDFCEQQA